VVSTNIQFRLVDTTSLHTNVIRQIIIVKEKDKNYIARYQYKYLIVPITQKTLKTVVAAVSEKCIS